VDSIPISLSREKALAKLKLLEGKDLRPLADEFRVTVWKNNRKNKGWAGEIIERYLELAANSRQGPDFGEWELKVVPLKLYRGKLTVKETMAITMISPSNVIATPFEHSHLLDKLQRMIVCAREFVDEKETRAPFIRASSFDLSDGELFRAVQADYEEIRAAIRQRGLRGITGKLGKLVQARTKGTGHGSETKAFYAREKFVARILGLEKN
jgi:DNA mismatch repair protein MutH